MRPRAHFRVLTQYGSSTLITNPSLYLRVYFIMCVPWSEAFLPMDSGVEETKGNHRNGCGDDDVMDVCDAGPSPVEETPGFKRIRPPDTLLGDDAKRAARRLHLSGGGLSLEPRVQGRVLFALGEPSSKSDHGRHGEDSDEEDSEADEEGDEDEEEEGDDEEEEETEEVRQVLGKSIVHRHHRQINRHGECDASSNHTGQLSVKPPHLE